MTTFKTIRKLWSADEDKLLLQLTEKHGTNGCWPLIAESMISRSGKQCRERYINHLDPNMKRSPWTPKEDQILMDHYPEFRNKWSRYMSSLPGRSDNAIKNRYHVVSRLNADCNSASDESVKKRSCDDEYTAVEEGRDARLKRLKAQRQLLDDQIREIEEEDTETLPPVPTDAAVSSEPQQGGDATLCAFSAPSDVLSFEFDFNDELLHTLL